MLFPAFAAVYVIEISFWQITLAVLAIEFFIATRYLKGLLWDRLFGLVFIANLFSVFFGFIFMFLLPSGWQADERGFPQFTPIAKWYMLAGFPIACVVSIIVEAVVIKIFQPNANPSSLWKAVTFANVASYLFVIVAYTISLWMQDR